MNDASTADRIVEATRTLVVTEGSAAVSIRRVAADVGVTAMALYRHFESKEHLLNRVADAAFARLAEEWHAGPPGSDLRTGMSRLVDDFVDVALAQPHLFDFLFLERRPGGRRYPEDFRRGDSPTLNPVYEMVAASMRAGGPGDDEVWEVVFSAVAQVQGLVQLYRGDRINLPEPEFRALCHRAVDRILDALDR